MPNCAVILCNNHNRNTKGSTIKFFRFPKDANLSKQWIIACRRQDKINVKNARICSVHFEETCFEVPLKERLMGYEPVNSRHLKPDAVPTLNSFQKRKRPSEEREVRYAQKGRREEVKNILAETVVMQTAFIEPQTSSDNIDSSVSTKATSVFTREMEIELNELRHKVKLLDDQNNELRREAKEAKESTEQKYEAMLSKMFTKGQIKKLKCSDHDKRMGWSPEDIASAISLRSSKRTDKKMSKGPRTIYTQKWFR